jgi:hypothetical protein
MMNKGIRGVDSSKGMGMKGFMIGNNNYNPGGGSKKINKMTPLDLYR